MLVVQVVEVAARAQLLVVVARGLAVVVVEVVGVVVGSGLHVQLLLEAVRGTVHDRLARVVGPSVGRHVTIVSDNRKVVNRFAPRGLLVRPLLGVDSNVGDLEATAEIVTIAHNISDDGRTKDETAVVPDGSTNFHFFSGGNLNGVALCGHDLSFRMTEPFC